jgi:hypothetical protein
MVMTMWNSHCSPVAFPWNYARGSCCLKYAQGSREEGGSGIQTRDRRKLGATVLFPEDSSWSPQLTSPQEGSTQN